MLRSWSRVQQTLRSGHTLASSVSATAAPGRAFSKPATAASSAAVSAPVAAPLAARSSSMRVSSCSHSRGRAFSSSTASRQEQQQQQQQTKKLTMAEVVAELRRGTHHETSSRIRNIAIIAHVDHGKTTLVDRLLQQSGTLQINAESGERVMDSNDLERERGITILAKVTSILRGEYRINIVDTPGHADFGGEVERVLSMVDGVILVVCATEGPMAQTKFVLSKALQQGLSPIVVINKADRSTARFDVVDSNLFDLFGSLGASDEQMNYPIIFASAREGWAIQSMNDKRDNMDHLFDTIIKHVPPPKVRYEDPFSMLVTQIEVDKYLGKLFLGRIVSGKIAINEKVRALDPDSKVLEEGRVQKLLAKRGLENIPVETAIAGDIISIAGLSRATVNSTICAPECPEALPSTPIDPPTISMTFSANNSPLAGRDGKSLTANVLGERLRREAESNVAIRVIQRGDNYEVCGRGELQLGILIETIRREGWEVSVSPPMVVCKRENGAIMEPIEEVIVDVEQEYAGLAIEKLTLRKGVMKNYDDQGSSARITFEVPTRGLIGFQAEFKNDTHGTGVVTHIFLRYDPFRGAVERSRKGALISMETGDATAFALQSLESRGVLFIGPGDPVYAGMVIGEHNRDTDLEVNPTKQKALSNMRSVQKEEFFRLAPKRTMGLEEIIAYCQDDEVIEVTTKRIRLRKRMLDSNARKMAKKQNMSGLTFADE